MNPLQEWAAAWNIPAEAMADLARRLGALDTPPPAEGRAHSEAWPQSQVRIEASAKGMRIWRNNVGALLDQRGVPVRYGLANDNPQLNRKLKSADLIGIKPVRIQPHHVGQVIGQFLSREMKFPGWKYRGDDHEVAQMNWALLVLSLGGDASFATGRGTL